MCPESLPSWMMKGPDGATGQDMGSDFPDPRLKGTDGQLNTLDIQMLFFSSKFRLFKVVSTEKEMSVVQKRLWSDLLCFLVHCLYFN